MDERTCRPNTPACVYSYYAHSLPGKPPDQWQPLDEHLNNVANLAGEFAAKFDAEDWARVSGLLHDIGKSSLKFQDYLRSHEEASAETESGRVDHSTAGAQCAVAALPIIGHLLAYIVAGHHSGLLDGRAVGACQENRLKKEISRWDNDALPPIQWTDLTLPSSVRGALGNPRDPFVIAFFVRMVFSTLVDADFLDTEAFNGTLSSIGQGGVSKHCNAPCSIYPIIGAI